ncbi:MAG: DUF1801 domain-containing protein [Bacteroidota bacterium]
MEANRQLKEFLAPYDSDIQELSYALRAFITSTIPEANELIWDNYNAVAIAYSKSEQLKDAFCHLAVYAKHVNFGFNRGVELKNKLIKLEGKGKLIRHLKVTNMEGFPRNEIEEMIYQAVGIADHRNPQLINKISAGLSIVMSVSNKKVRPK